MRPPNLDLANRNLVEAHLHAVWLAESGKELEANIPQVLDLTAEALPVQDEIAEALADPAMTARAAEGMHRILKSIDAELSPEAAPWAVDRESFVATTAAEAAQEFSKAFGRWRQLYESARAQLVEANRRSEMHGLSATDRRAAKAQQAQANEQISLLERGRATGGSDFYTYRYLATEGFLPGYNFPRLPLYAFVPAVSGGGPKAAWLQRARFLAIAEFGPGSLVYHEGRAFRVYKAKLPPNARSDDGARLATSVIYVCDDCGAAHQGLEPERCHACNASMGGTHPINNVLRIDNVETLPTERITANDEDRQRQGFEIQTVFTWPQRHGVLDVRQAIAADETGPVLSLDYAPGATVTRLNKGLRRRKEKSILGFGIDPASGRWVGKKDDADGDDPPDEPVKQRVVPMVQDHKNTLLVRLKDKTLPDATMATLQHALARGLEIIFQLEEGEVLTEPVPARENRRGILAFEASEGGAGVLGRLTSDPVAISRVARAALDLMHYRDIDVALPTADLSLLTEDPDANCVKGCYRCLLSYYNQPDHELIDRTDDDVRSILLRLARSEVRIEGQPSGSSDDGGWRTALAHWDLPPPDDEPITVASSAVPLVWRTHLVAAVPGALEDEVRSAAEALGYSIVAVPEVPGDAPPPELVKLLGVPA